MDIVIYGAGTYCGYLLEAVKKYEEVNVIGIADSNIKGKRFGYTVLNLMDSGCDIPKNTIIVVAMANHHSADAVAKKLKDVGYKSIYLYLNKTKTFKGDFLAGECLDITGSDDLTLPSVEFQTVDFCNLNCRGCSHFSPLFEHIFPNFDVRMQDLRLLRKLFHSIQFISILGGEPLISPDIGQYIVETRELFPEAEIQIVTNGLLIQGGGY